jgi:hypothetical protein
MENTTARRVEVIEDDCTETAHSIRDVIVRFLDEESGFEHIFRRYRIRPSESQIRNGNFQEVKEPEKRLSALEIRNRLFQEVKESEKWDLWDKVVFLPTFTRDEQHSIARPLTHKYSASELTKNLRFYWVFRDLIYSTAEAFTPDEMTALILDAENRKKARVARAMRKTSQETPGAPERRQPIPDDVKIFVWKRDEGRCVKCGSNRNLEFDHIIPWSMGGSDTTRNLQLLCEECNNLKGGSL